MEFSLSPGALELDNLALSTPFDLVELTPRSTSVREDVDHKYTLSWYGYDASHAVTRALTPCGLRAIEQRRIG